jgi:hypothetical protein
MGNNPNLVFRQDLTDFATGVMQDNAKVLAEIKRIAPPVPTGVLAGRYPEFNNLQDFAINDTKRVSGGSTADAKFAGTMTDFTLQPNALQIGVDQEIEIPMAGGNILAVEQAKTHTLLAQSVGSLASDVYSLLKTGRAAHATFGKWSDANVDPLDELEAAAIEIYEATGLWPNHIDITPQMWRYVKKHPLTLKRFGGKNAAINMQDVGNEVGIPDMQLVTGAGLSSGDFGQTTAAFQPMLGKAAWVYYSNPMASGQNATFAMTLSRDLDMLGGVYEYMTSDGTVKKLRLAWFVKPVVVSSALARRIVYS